MSGQWIGKTAGGCTNNPSTYTDNPCFQIKIDSNQSNNTLLIDLKGPRQYQIGFDVYCMFASDETVKEAFGKKSSGPYRYTYPSIFRHSK